MAYGKTASNPAGKTPKGEASDDSAIYPRSLSANQIAFRARCLNSENPEALLPQLAREMVPHDLPLSLAYLLTAGATPAVEDVVKDFSALLNTAPLVAECYFGLLEYLYSSSLPTTQSKGLHLWNLHGLSHLAISHFATSSSSATSPPISGILLQHLRMLNTATYERQLSVRLPSSLLD